MIELVLVFKSNEFFSLSLFHCQILWENRFHGDTGEDCLVSVDGVDFEIEEPWPYKKEYSKRWYSDKYKGPGVRYMICVSLKKGDIVRIAGPVACGKMNDGMMFERYLIDELGPYERVEADAGYQAFDPEFAKTPANANLRPEEHAKLSNTVRARQETINKRCKQWGCLRQVYRHELQRHAELLRAVAVITQFAIDEGEKLFEVCYTA